MAPAAANTNFNGAPPASSLAAELVGNISTAARSNRPDENSELKRLFEQIEAVKNNPDSLKSAHERVEHNHVLIYVYACVVLEGLKWDDPFANTKQLCADAEKAIRFLRVTIQETPAVLNLTTPRGTFLRRGPEPLWVWLFPKLLKMLGRSKCLALTSALNSFFVFVLVGASKSAGLWNICEPLYGYLQANFRSIVTYLDSGFTTDRGLDLELPQSGFLDSLLSPEAEPSLGCLYSLVDCSHAIQHAYCLLTILHKSALQISRPEQQVVSLNEHLPWLVDSLAAVNQEQKRWQAHCNYDPTPFLQLALDMSASVSDLEVVLLQKLDAIIVFLTADLAELYIETKHNRSDAYLANRTLSFALVHLADAATQSRPVSKLVAAQLLNVVDRLSATQNFNGRDLKSSITLIREGLNSPAIQALSRDALTEMFCDKDLQLKVLALQTKRSLVKNDARVTKRRTSCVLPTSVTDLVGKLCTIIGIPVSSSLDSLEDPLIHKFPLLVESEQCMLIELLTCLPCASDNSLTFAQAGTGNPTRQCSICVKQGKQKTPLENHGILVHAAVSRLFFKLSDLPSFRESRRPRVVAMIALRRLILHCRDAQTLDLEQSALGQWCLQSLQSSLRELRIAAGRAITLFVRRQVGQDVGVDVLNRNTANVLSIMRTISDRNEPSTNETCLMAWGQIGTVVSDEGLNLVLVKMIEFLGHSNPIISAVALNEMTNLASQRRTSPRRLLEPFWRNLAYATVKDMLRRPQITQMVADLLKTSITELLLLIQSHALPWLVLHRKRDVILRFLDARRDLSQPHRKQTEQLWTMLYMDNANLSAILSRLLVQDVPNIEEYIRSLLHDVCPDHEVPSLKELLSTNPVPTTFELLKMGGEGGAMRSSARSALTLVAELMATGSKDTKRRKGQHTIARFLAIHALGLSTIMIQVITSHLPVALPIQERRRCIRAMDEMINLGKGYLRLARPQISACLFSAFSLDDLRGDVFTCWYSMVTNMEQEEEMIETTFLIIGQYWTSFDQATREKSKSLLDFLWDNHSNLLSYFALKLPSLDHIEELAEFREKLSGVRPPLDTQRAIPVFIERLKHGNSGVVQQGLIELSKFLLQHQGEIQTSALSEQQSHSVTSLMRALLNCAAKYNGRDAEVSKLCAECIGFVGCLDSTRLETVREHREFIMTSNFEDAGETTDFVAFMLQHVLVASFVSTTDTTLQGFLSYAMQQLLDKCDFKTAVALQGEGPQCKPIFDKWMLIPEEIRDVLFPFITSKYKLEPMPHVSPEYPILRAGRSYPNWLRQFTLDLLHRGQNTFAMIIFDPLCRTIRVKDLSVAVFLLPYLVVHITLGQQCTSAEQNAVWNELNIILQHQVPEDASYLEKEDQKLLCEAVFRVIDYCMRWIQVKKAWQPDKAEAANVALVQQKRTRNAASIALIQARLDAIPAELLAQRAIDCKQYARALFHLEPHILRQQQALGDSAVSVNQALDSLQHVYAQIDEPDGLEGVSACLKVIDLNQQILSHKKAGRWSRAQTWCEVLLAEQPNNADVQLDLLTCLKESGQHHVLLNYVSGMTTDAASINKIAPFAVEAAWATSRWDALQKYLALYNGGNHLEVFELGIGSALLSLKEGHTDEFLRQIQELKEKVACSMSFSATASLQASHDSMLKCHVLADLDIIARSRNQAAEDQQQTMTLLNRRLEVLGAYVNNKQYVLGICRAAMELLRPTFSDGDISSLWLSSARLARKANSLPECFNAVLRASQLGDRSATIQDAKLLWKEGHHRKAIQILEHALQTDAFIAYDPGAAPPTASKGPETQRNRLIARTHLLLAKWQDSVGQTHSSALRLQYQQAAKTYGTWEKGHYHLGRHYKKVLESEKALPPDNQSDEYLTGETAKLVIENYLRSLNYGTKYLYQTLPRILTLWMDMGAQVDKAPAGKVSLSGELHQRRKAVLLELNKYFYKHMQRMPAYIFYTAMPQIVARITHPNPDMFSYLQHIIIKIVEVYPRQALWGLFAIMTTRQAGLRMRRGMALLTQLRDSSGKKVDGSSFDLKQLCRMGEKLAEQLLLACNNGNFQSNRTTHASLSNDLHFNTKCVPCPLVVPIEACLTAALPTVTDNVKKHKAFSKDVVSIAGFSDDVLVLGSLAKPRRLTARGTDGKLYNLLIKPKDDLRTDQRLMEFNAMINRSLKRDAECSRRQLYIRTYAVTPLNEECGIIEWVDGLKTLRDILLGIYRTRGIAPNYNQLAEMMKEATLSDKNLALFEKEILGMFPSVLPTWFISQFPNPSAWFAARLKYTRSCAVMSMVGTILGLGDRHGENILLEEGNGGVFHVDFNCLFDKGLTFALPEKVPFRLTHNMVAAMGIYGYEGPFRQCSELTLSILRQQEETLMTILEAFIYDPTLDLQRDKKRKNDVIKLNPTSVVESINRKVRGLLPDESIPLGVEGQVQELIRQATDAKNLASMYIGWCPFL
ncbi:phosphatidylinositol 3 [Coniella lustricola]|uniref:Serine/threonine-protein kinase MEC1 n=1 Tax=Coniella lustricola TaxID=2025994 RepID=A0A2T3ABW9_9PEZI|nr:phosphatidylinositol 3 [Coniella lustricola]